MQTALPEQSDKEHMLQQSKEWGRWTERQEVQAHNRWTILIGEIWCKGGVHYNHVTTGFCLTLSFEHTFVMTKHSFYCVYDWFFACMSKSLCSNSDFILWSLVFIVHTHRHQQVHKSLVHKGKKNCFLLIACFQFVFDLTLSDRPIIDKSTAI